MSGLSIETWDGYTYIRLGEHRVILLTSIEKIEITASKIKFHSIHTTCASINHTSETFRQLESIVKEYGHLMMKKIDQ